VSRAGPLLAIASLIFLSADVSGQADRFEVGQRLRAWEAAWEAHPTAEARQRAVPHLKLSVNYFFLRRMGEAGRALDLARFALESPEAPSAERRWAASLDLTPETRFADTDSPEIRFTLAPFYPVDVPPPPDARLSLSLKGARPGPSLVRSSTIGLGALPHAGRLRIGGLAEGDYTLRAEIMAGKRVLEAREQTLSLAGSLAARIDRLRLAADDLPRGETGCETARGLAALLEMLLDGKPLETNYPAARLLAEADAALKAQASGRSYYGWRRAGQFWLTLPTSAGPTPSRLLAPAAVKQGSPLPLIIAMHGSGGSENLFFEAYGRGAMVRLCEQRGYLLLAPRGAGFSPRRALELIDGVAGLYPVDRQRVFLVGHSLGAMQAMSSAAEAPERFAGVAALGGGWGGRVSPGLRGLRFFIGVGLEDFALPVARALDETLRQGGVASIRLREYPDTEHLAVVQVALPEVFAFFDETAKR